ncbi:hypothetical protein TG4357_03755 [Thalassovita gelatinovora]|uniref:Uncharacterized protein n=1 Tax=Thalassovita gelatinovora TaxID=53501 RepID=A0A0P1FKS4_THAGE|nr:hypothetical protein TG4357_03755 [Thalassovita gelatinovora]SEQ57215.1 hypothetical protein SAMN04488043_106216 [Thalassovita gelatinovora]
MRIFGKKTKSSKTVSGKDDGKRAPKGHVMVVRTMTMPSGKTARVVRKDALDRALARSKDMAAAG